MLKLDSVSKGYTTGWLVKKRTPVLEDVTLSIKPGALVGLVGASGSGKSTLARLLLGLTTPDQGRVVLDDTKDLSRLSSRERRQFRQKIQFVAQHPETVFNPRLKIGSSLVEVVRHFHLCPPKDAESLLAPLFKGLQLNLHYLDRYPHQLSGGEIQRLALARALLPSPQLVVLDEVTSMLDVSVQAHLVNLLLEIHESRHASFLFISHNLPLVNKICHPIFEVANGRLVKDAP